MEVLASNKITWASAALTEHLFISSKELINLKKALNDLHRFFINIASSHQLRVSQLTRSISSPFDYSIVIRCWKECEVAIDAIAQLTYQLDLINSYECHSSTSDQTLSVAEGNIRLNVLQGIQALHTNLFELAWDVGENNRMEQLLHEMAKFIHSCSNNVSGLIG